MTATLRPISLRQHVLMAGVVLALGSVVLAALQVNMLLEGRSEAAPAAQVRARPVERAIAALREQLMIDPAQMPEWDRLVDLLRANVHLLDVPPARRPAGRGASAAAHVEARMPPAQALRDLGPALAALYGVMSPAQRQAADRAFRTWSSAGGTAS